MAGSLAREKKAHRQRERERAEILCSYLHKSVFFFFASKHICLGWVDCLAAAGGKSAGTVEIFLDENAFTTLPPS